MAQSRSGSSGLAGQTTLTEFFTLKPKHSVTQQLVTTLFQHIEPFTPTTHKETVKPPTRPQSHILDDQQQNDAQVSRTNRSPTPLERQVLQIKAEHPEKLIMVECGYRYRFFGNDAKIAVSVLDIMLTSSGSFAEHASIPVHRLNVHLARLVAHGFTVGLVKQMETCALRKASKNANPGTFQRKLVATINSSNIHLFISTGVEQDVHVMKGNALLFISETYSSVQTRVDWICLHPLECVVEFGSVEDSVQYSQVSTLFNQEWSQCSKVIHFSALSKQLSTLFRRKNLVIEHSTCSVSKSSDYLESFFGVDGDFDWLKKRFAALQNNGSFVQLLGKAVSFSEVFGFQEIFRNVNSYSMSAKLGFEQLQVSEFTRRNLQITKDPDNPQSSCLLEFLDRTKSISGRNVLKDLVMKPLTNASDMNLRIQAISDLIFLSQPSSPTITYLNSFLKEFSNFQLLIAKINCEKIEPFEVAILLKALSSLEVFCSKSVLFSIEFMKSSVLRELFRTMQRFFFERSGVPNDSWDEGSNLLRMVNNLPNRRNAPKQFSSKESNTGEIIFRDYSRFPQLERYINDIKSVEGKLDDELRHIQRDYSDSAKWSKTLNLAYVIDIPVKEARNIPRDWISFPSTKELARFRSPEIQELADLLAQAIETFCLEQSRCWKEFLVVLKSCAIIPELKTLCHCLGMLDAILSLAEVSSSVGYIRPRILEHSVASVNLVNFRHPLLESHLSGRSCYIPNSCRLSDECGHTFIVTGPNMGGKSTFLRGVGLISLMAHIGCYVPADFAEISVMDSIFCRSGASDRIFSGGSTFFVEMKETNEILQKATAKSLVLIDELGRGTSTFDGVAIAYATLKYLIEKRCPAIFVSHYHSLAKEMISLYPLECSSGYCSFKKLDSGKASAGNGGIVWLYQMVPGICPESYAMEVASLAGIPTSILERASEKSLEFRRKSEMGIAQ